MSKNKMLRTLSLTLRLLGWLVFLGSIALGGVIVAMPEVLVTYGFGTTNTPWISALGILFMGIIYAITFLAASEFITLAISIEDNTRRLKDFFVSDKNK